jgi:hypothetical protein
MSRGEDIIKMQEELASMPEYQLERKLKSLEYSCYVFNQNYSELQKLLLIYKDLKKSLQLWDEKNRHAQEAFRLEVTRLLHNFVASVKSLVEHSRILHRDLYEKNNKFTDYQEEIKNRFAENPLAQFVEDLRDYCLHYKTPPIFSQMSFTKDPPPPRLESSIRLDIEVLERYSNWCPLAKQYLDEQKNRIDTQIDKYYGRKNRSIDVLDLVSQYFDLVIDFHKWLYTRQSQIHAYELSKLKDKRQELRELIVPDAVEGALTQIERTKKNPDEAFYPILTPKQREELKNIPLNSNQHVEKLITIIQTKAPIAEELQSKIRDIYQQFTCSSQDII